MQQNNDNIHIYIKYPENYPDEFIETDLSEFKSDKLKIKLEKIDYGPFAAIEWTIPTVIAAYVLKPYFESFLKEAGKEHYQLLKKGLKNLTGKGKSMNVRLLTASESTEKLNKKYNQSLAVAIHLQTVNEREIKLLFDNDLDKSDWDSALDQLLDFVIKNYENSPNDRLTELLSEFEDHNGTIYGKINPKSKYLEFYDSKKLIIELKNKNYS